MENDNNIDNLFGIEDESVFKYLSYSRLSDFDKNGPKVLLKRTNPDNYGIKIGSIVDDLLLPLDNFEFEKEYIISDIEKPSATSGKLIDIVLKQYLEVPDEKELLRICKVNSFWKTFKDEKKLEIFKDNKIIDYLKLHIKGSKASIITTEEFNESKNLADILKSHEFSKNYFIPVKGVDVYNQFGFIFKLEGIYLRGSIDMIRIDHNKKTIQLIDLKTGAPSYSDFIKNYVKFRYYLQEAIYMQSVSYIKDFFEIHNYELLPFRFLYISRSEKIPITIEVPESWHYGGLNGFSIRGYKYKGLLELIDEVKWHFSNKEFELPKDVVNNNGNIELNTTNLISNKNEI